MQTANTRRQTQRLSLQWTEGITGAKTCLLNTSPLFVVRLQPEWEEEQSGSRWRWVWEGWEGGGGAGGVWSECPEATFRGCQRRGLRTSDLLPRPLLSKVYIRSASSLLLLARGSAGPRCLRRSECHKKGGGDK